MDVYYTRLPPIAAATHARKHCSCTGIQFLDAQRLSSDVSCSSICHTEGWLPVTSSGNDCFLRNPRNIDENLFVDITSPSSSTYQTVTELGSPEDTANLKLDQFLNKEFMSTRLGIRREGKVLFSETRVGNDGRTYYDIGIRMSSYGSRNPYVATQVSAQHTHTHTHARTHARTHTHTHRHTSTNARTHTHTQARTHEQAHTSTHIYIPSSTHTHKHTYTHKHTHTHKHMQTHFIPPCFCSIGALSGKLDTSW